MDFISNFIRLRIIPILRNKKIRNLILGAIDILSIVLAFQCSYSLNYFDQGGFFFFQIRLLKIFFLIMPFWLFILYLIQISEIPRTKRYIVLFFEYLQSTILIISLLLVFYFIFKLYEISRLFLIEFALLGFLFLFLTRLLEYKLFKVYRAKGYNSVNIILIADDSSLLFIESLLSNKDWGYRIIAIFTGSVQLKEKYEKGIILLPEENLKVLNDLMEVNILDEVLYIKNKVIPKMPRLILSSFSGGTEMSLTSISLAPISFIFLSNSDNAFLYQNFTIKIRAARQANIKGNAFIIKSSNVNPDFEAISIPMGLPSTVPLEPILVARTEIIKNGVGSTSK